MSHKTLSFICRKFQEEFVRKIRPKKLKHCKKKSPVSSCAFSEQSINRNLDRKSNVGKVSGRNELSIAVYLHLTLPKNLYIFCLNLEFVTTKLKNNGLVSMLVKFSKKRHQGNDVYIVFSAFMLLR